jgi:hypothetical protein
MLSVMAPDLKSPYLCWQGVASRKFYAVQRWDDVLSKNPAGPPFFLSDDKPLAARWPARVVCVVESTVRSGKPTLPDYLMNSEQWLAISGPLRACLEKAGVPDVEYLPVQVIDPTGLPLSDSYSIAHTLNSPDCLDLKASGATQSRVIPSKAEKIQRIVFKNDPGRPLFRPSKFGKITFVSWALAETLADHGFTGFRFMGLFDYGHPGDLPPHPKRAPIDALCTRLQKNAQARESAL